MKYRPQAASVLINIFSVHIEFNSEYIYTTSFVIRFKEEIVFLIKFCRSLTCKIDYSSNVMYSLN